MPTKPILLTPPFRMCAATDSILGLKESQTYFIMNDLSSTLCLSRSRPMGTPSPCVPPSKHGLSRRQGTTTSAQSTLPR